MRAEELPVAGLPEGGEEPADFERAKGPPPPASGILLYLLLLIALALLFALWPGLDLAATRFARSLAGGEFAPRDGSWSPLYHWMKPAFFALGIGVILLGLASWRLQRPLLGITPRRAFFVVASLVLIQGLVIDLYLKGSFGRARPRELEAFGGEFLFTPFYMVSEACQKNCSFVSGHAGMAFSFLALSFLPKSRRNRLLALGAALLFGLVTGWMRVVQGGHFLSDVLFAGMVVFGLTWLMALLCLRPWPRGLARLLPDHPPVL